MGFRALYKGGSMSAIPTFWQPRTWQGNRSAIFFLKAGQVFLGAVALAKVALPQRSQTESNLGILLVVKPAEDPLVARTGSMQIW